MSNDIATVYDPASLLSVSPEKKQEAEVDTSLTQCPRMFILGDKGPMNAEAMRALVKQGAEGNTGDLFIKDGDEYHAVPKNALFFMVANLMKRGAVNKTRVEPGSDENAKIIAYRDEVPRRSNEGSTADTTGFNEEVLAVLLILDRDTGGIAPVMVGLKKAECNAVFGGGWGSRKTGLFQRLNDYSGEIGNKNYIANATRLGISNAEAKRRVANGGETFFVGIEFITGSKKGARGTYATLDAGMEFAPSKDEFNALIRAVAENETFKNCVKAVQETAEFRDSKRATKAVEGDAK